MSTEALEAQLQSGLRAAAERDADPVRTEAAHAFWAGRAAQVAEAAGDLRAAETAREHQRAARERLAVARAEVRREIGARRRRVARIIVLRELARHARPRARRDSATSKRSASGSGDDPPGGEPALLPAVYPRRRVLGWSELVEPPTLRPRRQLDFGDEEARKKVSA